MEHNIALSSSVQLKRGVDQVVHGIPDEIARAPERGLAAQSAEGVHNSIFDNAAIAQGVIGLDGIIQAVFDIIVIDVDRNLISLA
jgi:hypothetical protein